MTNRKCESQPWETTTDNAVGHNGGKHNFPSQENFARINLI